ncbi:MAG: hypothetical protein HY268_08940 [Deltaproteobacteria bacterium]|nr:hypothetical protein [Deltaproteobacteria bacterium]
MKLVMDEVFADYFRKDKARALQSINIVPTTDMLAALDQVDFDAISKAASLIPHQSNKPN